MTDPGRKGGKLTIFARLWDQLRAAAADASAPGHSDRVARAIAVIEAELRAKRDQFDFDGVVQRYGIDAAAAKDAAATIYQSACEEAAAQDMLTVVELDSLEALAVKIRLTPRDVGAVHNVVGMPPFVDPVTGELKPFGYSGALKVVAIAGVTGRAIGGKLAGAGGAAASATLAGIRSAMAKRASAQRDVRECTDTVERALRLRCCRGRLGQQPAEPAVEVHGRTADMVRTLAEAASRGRCVEIQYQKSPKAGASVRLIEVGNGLHYRGVLMVRAWQVLPEIASPCWRTFRLDRIRSLSIKTTSTRQGIQSSLIKGEVVEWSPAELDMW